MSTYLLIMIGKKTDTVRVGSLGEVSLTPGCYLYVGSARRHLDARLRRHLRPDKKRRWHIDYLLSGEILSIQEIWIGDQVAECQLANNLLALPEISIPQPRFGASDCRCQAHFFFYDSDPAKLRQNLLTLGLSPYQGPARPANHSENGKRKTENRYDSRS